MKKKSSPKDGTWKRKKKCCIGQSNRSSSSFFCRYTIRTPILFLFRTGAEKKTAVSLFSGLKAPVQAKPTFLTDTTRETLWTNKKVKGRKKTNASTGRKKSKKREKETHSVHLPSLQPMWDGKKKQSANYFDSSLWKKKKQKQTNATQGSFHHLEPWEVQLSVLLYLFFGRTLAELLNKETNPRTPTI